MVIVNHLFYLLLFSSPEVYELMEILMLTIAQKSQIFYCKMRSFVDLHILEECQISIWDGGTLIVSSTV